MNTFLTLNQQPIYIITNKATLWNNHTFPHIKTSWKLHAQAKGFGNASKNTSIQQKGNVLKPGSDKQGNEGGGGGGDDDDKIPQVVFDRMLKRILISVGLPMAIGFACLKLIDYLKETQIWDVPLWVVFVTTFVFFGSSVLGVAYGSLSTNWDGEENTSILGFDEAKVNWNEMWKEDNNEDNNKK